MSPERWRGCRVLLTGHTGFKGSWAAALLSRAGAEVSGLALRPPTEPSLWGLVGERLGVRQHIVDIRDAPAVAKVCAAVQPEIVIHMAAQSQVRVGYADPVGTYATNVLGTANLLEALRRERGLQAVLVVTSDKVYRNDGNAGLLREESELGGSDPYSASKAAAELITRSYAEAFFDRVPVATARGGNVLGGGDFSDNRLVPDIFRAVISATPVRLRYPDATRPWQHVLDCLFGYFAYVEHLQRVGRADPPALNFGPQDRRGELTVGELAVRVGRALRMETPWIKADDGGLAEKPSIRLDATKASRVLGWRPKLGLDDTLALTAEWYARYKAGDDPLALITAQIDRYSARSAGSDGDIRGQRC